VPAETLQETWKVDASVFQAYGDIDHSLRKAPIMMVFDRSVIPATILVVEDEMMIRMSTVDMVEDAGYAPLEAVDADGAVAMLESRSDIALMVTDIQMPGNMDGVELAQAVHKRWPLIKIIVVSGLKQPIDLPADSCFLGKPVEATGMISRMQSMIGHA
jgi:CheY-like chemotaxis protein